MPKYEKGILGVRKDPKNQILFSFNVREGDEWPSDDSDYKPGEFDFSKSKEGASSDDNELTQGAAGKKKSSKNPSKKLKRDDKDRNARKNKSADKETLSSATKCTLELPLELWVKIFHFIVDADGALPFLPRASRVCQSWYEVASQPSLWHKVDLSYGWIRADEKCLEWLCNNRLSQTKDLNLSQCKGVNTKILKMISQSCPNLRSICLTQCRKCPADTLTILADGCKHLEDVDVSFTNNDVVSHVPLRGFITTQGSCIRRLTLGGNTFVGLNLVLNDLMEKCPNLELLDISNAEFSNCILPLNIEKFQAGCPKLEILRLANSLFRANSCSQREQAGSEGFLHLKELSIASKMMITCSSSGIVDTSSCIPANLLYRLLKTSYNLKLLDMRGISQYSCIVSLLELPIEGLERLYMHCSAVSRFDMLQDLIKKWKHSLLEVDLSYNSFHGEILDLGLYAITQGEGQSPLQRLNIAGTPVNLLPVQSILELCRDLQYLNLTLCCAIPRGFRREYRNRQEIDKLRKDILHCRNSYQMKPVIQTECLHHILF